MEASWEKSFGVLEQKVDSEWAQEIVSRILLVKLPLMLHVQGDYRSYVSSAHCFGSCINKMNLCCDYQCLAMNFRYTNHLHSYM